MFKAIKMKTLRQITLNDKLFFEKVNGFEILITDDDLIGFKMKELIIISHGENRMEVNDG